MQKAISETSRRRELQLEFNRQHGITPKTIEKEIRSVLADQLRARQTARKALCADQQQYDQTELLNQLEHEMLAAAEALEFEKATRLRDRISELKEQSQDAAEKTKNKNSKDKKSGKSISDLSEEEPPDTKENWEYKEPTKTTRGTKRKKRP
jgi:excinuclease ABC subunit B